MMNRTKVRNGIPACLALAMLILVEPGRAGTKTWDGGSTGTGSLWTSNTNWAGDLLPTTSDEILMDNSVVATLPAQMTFSAGSNLTAGDVIWNTNNSSTLTINTSTASNSVLTLSGGGGSTAAVAAGGASGDLLLLGSAATTSTFTLSGNVGAGGGRFSLTLATSGNFDVVNSGATLNIGVAINETGGARSITKTGAGTLILAGTNSYTGGTQITSGSVQLGNGGTTGTLSTTGAISISSGANFTINRSDTVTQGTDFSSAPITGSGRFVKSGTGTTIFNAANSYSGGTTIASGTLTVNTGGTMGASTGSLTMSASGIQVQILNLNVDQTVGSLNGTVSGQASSTINIASGKTFTVNQASSSSSWGGVIAGAGGFTKSGAGLFTLTGVNTYSGTTTINGGTLALGNATNTLSNSVFIDIVAGTLSLGNNSDTVGNVVLETGSITGTGGTLTSTNYDMRSGSVSANLAGTGTAMFKSSSGTLVLTGTNTYNGGTTINGGDVWFDNASALGSGAINFGPNGLDSMSLMSTAPASLPNNITINDLSPTVGRTATLGSFSTAASGANAYTGNIVLNNDLIIKSSSPDSNPLTFSTGVISGTNGLTINPSGTISPGAVKLDGNNTYAGNTSIAAGTLLATGGTVGSLTNSATGTGTVTVTGTGTILAGGSGDGLTGSILGTVNIGANSKLSPGTSGDGTSSTAILHTGALTLTSGSTFTLNLNSTTAGTGYDQAISSGSINFNGATLAVTVGGTLNLGDTFFIFENSSLTPNGVGAFTNGATVVSGGYTFLIDYFDTGDATAGNDISLTVTAIPEPGTWIGSALALGAIAVARRRSRRS